MTKKYCLHNCGFADVHTMMQQFHSVVLSRPCMQFRTLPILYIMHYCTEAEKGNLA